MKFNTLFKISAVTTALLLAGCGGDINVTPTVNNGGGSNAGGDTGGGDRCGWAVPARGRGAWAQVCELRAASRRLTEPLCGV